MKPTSRKDYEENLRRLAVQAFAQHDVLTTVGPGHWRIKNSKNGHHWADIVVLGMGGIAVWGDIEAVVFAYGPRREAPEDVIAWLAGSALGYAREKASIGMTGIGDRTEDAEVALWDVLAELEHEDGPHAVALRRAADDLRRGDPVESVRNELFDAGLDGEVAGSIGEVVAPRVVYALEAVNRLHEMLKARSREDGGAA